jgi:DNA-binding response OmpR family regulator
MNLQTALVLTNDPRLESQFRHASRGEARTIAVVHDVEVALRSVCARLHELDLVLLDFPEGQCGIPLLSALHSCREELPVVIFTSTDSYHTSALAYANGAAACLVKPVTTEELGILLQNLSASGSVPAMA